MSKTKSTVQAVVGRPEKTYPKPVATPLIGSAPSAEGLRIPKCPDGNEQSGESAIIDHQPVRPIMGWRAREKAQAAGNRRD